MSTTTRDRRQEGEEHGGGKLDRVATVLARNLVDTSVILGYTVIRLLVEDIPVKVESNTIGAYKTVAEFTVPETYMVIGTSSYIGPLNKLLGTLHVRIDYGRINVLYADEAPHIMVTANWVNKYTYPPKDYVSWLFFVLNPHVRERVHMIAGEKNLPDTIAQEIVDMEIVSRKLDSINIDVGSFLTPVKLVESTITAEGIIELTRDISRTFNSIKYLIYMGGGEERETITITVRDGRDLGIYDLDLINVYKGTKILLKHLLSERELGYLNTIVPKIRDAVIKSYIAVKTLSKNTW